jgi:hypothetical protein
MSDMEAQMHPDRAQESTEDTETGGDAQLDDGSAADWRASLPPEMHSFANQFTSPTDAVKTALELRQKLSTSIQVPDADTDLARRLDVFNRLGRPETVEGYVVQPPENLPDWVSFEDDGVQDAQRSFLEAMHGTGATQDMIDTAFGWYWDHLAESESARDRVLESEFSDAEAGLRREWGRDFEANLEHAVRAVVAFGGRELGDVLEQYGLSNHPAVVRAFARAGRTMGEDDMISGPMTGTTRDQLKERAEDLVSEDDYWTNEAHQREMRQIMLQLYGENEIGPGAD